MPYQTSQPLKGVESKQLIFSILIIIINSIYQLKCFYKLPNPHLCPMNRLLLTLLIQYSLSIIHTAHSQVGCTDPLAANYNPQAVIGNNTCTYPATIQIGQYQQPNLPTEVNETSGLCLYQGLYYTLNDSGNEPILYALDTVTHAVVKRITLQSRNVDWEELTQDSLYFYIGDFGNNNGTRRDLAMLRVSKSSLPVADSGSTQAETIRFSYPDQTSFTSSNTHNFDCEAFIAMGDSLHMFSKNRGDNQTKHYTLPKTPGTFVARLHGTLAVNGLITGASLHPTRQEIALSGYTQIEAFIWLLFKFEGSDVFSGNRRRINLGSLALAGQAEGITYVDSGKAAISNERLSVGPITVPAHIAFINTGIYTHPAFTRQPVATTPIVPKPKAFRYQRTNGRLTIEALENLSIQVTSTEGRVVIPAQKLLPGKKEEFALPGNGVYWLKAVTQRGSTVAAAVEN